MDVENDTRAAAVVPDQEFTKGFQVDGSVPAKYRGKVSLAVKVSMLL